MTKRYYYDCAIEAAYMAKNFGMQFKSTRGVNLSYRGSGEFSTQDVPSGLYMGDRFYIMPESLPLLEPKYGDLFVGSERFLEEGQQPESIKTIQRDGKPFIWPEEQQAAGEL